MADEVQLDDAICYGPLPNLLAGLLLLEEDPSRANFFMQRYDELLKKFRDSLPAVESTVENLYGGIEHGEFGAWW